MGRAVNRTYTAWLAWAPKVGLQVIYTVFRDEGKSPAPVFDPTPVTGYPSGAWRHVYAGVPSGVAIVVASLNLCTDGLADATGISRETLTTTGRGSWVRRITGVSLESETEQAPDAHPGFHRESSLGPIHAPTTRPSEFRSLGQEGHPAAGGPVSPPLQEGRAGEHYSIVQGLPARLTRMERSLERIEANAVAIRDQQTWPTIAAEALKEELAAPRTRKRRPARAKSVKGSGTPAARPEGRSRSRGRI